MSKVELLEEKRRKIRDYLHERASSEKSKLEEHSIPLMAKKLDIPENELSEILLDLKKEKTLLSTHINFDAYVTSDDIGRKKRDYFDKDLRISSIMNAGSMVLLASVFILVLFTIWVKVHPANLLEYNVTNVALDNFSNGVFYALLGVVLFILVFKGFTDFLIKRRFLRKWISLGIVLVIGIVLIILSIKYSIVIGWMLSIIAILLQLHTMYKKD